LRRYLDLFAGAGMFARWADRAGHVPERRPMGVAMKNIYPAANLRHLSLAGRWRCRYAIDADLKELRAKAKTLGKAPTSVGKRFTWCRA
jgi:hypothetical protein